MDGREFWRRVSSHDKMTLVDVLSEPPAVVIHVPHMKFNVTVPLTDILNHSWGALEGVLLGKRQPRALHHLSRVVGYFGRIENWNRSKVAELKDRGKGDYAVSSHVLSGFSTPAFTGPIRFRDWSKQP